MKILTFDQFAAMPEGTIFSHYKPCVCEGLYRKGETLYRDDGSANDFTENSLVPNCWNGEHPSIGDDEWCRWGLYDFDALFAVFEPADVATAIKLLTP